jgi:predicted flap endonuclease-1-like 5' DNA nuclease
MNTFFLQHPLLSLLAALLLGMILKWVLDLFLLRGRMFELERQLTQRERDLTELRHEHNRALTDLKNRLTELDATQKAKTVLTGTLATREQDLAEVRKRLGQAEVEAVAAQGREEALGRELAAAASVQEALTAGIGSRDAALTAAAEEQERQRTEVETLRLAAEAAEAGLELGARQRGELEQALVRAGEAAREQDARWLTAQTESAALESARVAAQAEVKAAQAEVQAGQRQRDALAAELESARQAVAAAAKARTTLESALKQRERETADWERKVGEFRSAFDDAAKENRRLTQELAAAEKHREATRMEWEQAQGELARLAVPAVDPGLAARVTELESTLAQDAGQRASLEAELATVSASHARLERELAEARMETTRLETRLVEQPEELAEAGKDAAVAALLADLDQLTRERNEYAAELAALKAGPDAPARATARPTPIEPVEEFVAACPQHLSDVTGIGAVYETRLYSAGIGSYWELAQLSPAELAEILELDDPQRRQFDYAAVRKDAARLAKETQSMGRRWNQELPDDLEPIEGIGPAFEKKLYDAGLCTFAALAAATPEQLALICPGSPSRRPDYASWIAQAQRRVEGDGGED